MKIIDRKMESTTTKTFMDCCGTSQASFNSDGCIVLRNYDRHKKESDEIMVLSENETNAIIRLFQRLKSHEILPF